MDKAIFKLSFENPAEEFWFEQNQYGHLYDVPAPEPERYGGIIVFSFKFPELDDSTHLEIAVHSEGVNITRSLSFLTNFARFYPLLRHGAVYAAYQFIEDSFHLNDYEIPLLRKLIAPYLDELILEAYLGSWNFEANLSESRITLLSGFRSKEDFEALAKRFFSDGFTVFHTRVVGFRYRIISFVDQQGNLTLKVGDEVHLHRDYGNPHDNYAVAVIAQNGKQIGYLRRTIAYHIGHMMDQGVLLRAKVAALLADSRYDDEKVFIEIKRWVPGSEKGL